MSRLWNPHQVYSKIALWLDGNDPNGNNSHGLPDEGIAYDSWKDKSKNNVKFSAYPFSQFNNPEFVIEQVAELSVSGGAGYTNGSHLEIKLAPVSPSAGSSDVFVNYTVVSGAVTEVTSISGNHSYKIGDTLLEVVDQNNGGTNCVYTVTKLHRKGALVSAGSNGSDSLIDSLESEVLSKPLGSYLRVVFAANIRARNLNNISFIGLDDTSSSTNDVMFCLDGNSTTDKVGIGVQYKSASGQAHTFVSNFDENVPHIVSVELDADGYNITLDGHGILTHSGVPDPVLPQSTYRWTIFNNIDTNNFVSLKSRGMLHELLVFDEPLALEDSTAVYGYLSQKYHIPLNPFSTYYEATAYANSLFNGANKISPRQPIQVVKIYLDFCDNVYGQTSSGQSGRSNCTASSDAGNECYNTRHTCQDLNNFRLSTNGKKTYTFTSEVGSTLRGQLPNSHPALIKVTSAPVEIVPTKGVSLRGSISIELRDFVSTDSDADPYTTTRNIIALENGTYFSKLIQRNPHYINRPIEIYDGYIDYDGKIQINDGKKEYIIDSLQLSANTLKIKCKDPMSLADELKAKVPTPSKFSLKVAMAHGTQNNQVLRINNLDATAAQIESYFGTTGHCRIEKEIIKYSRNAGDAHIDFVGSNRGAWGSKQLASPDEYDAGELVQKCVVFGEYDGSGDIVTINDAVYELLVTEAKVPAKAINNESGGQYSWADQKSQWLSSYRIDAIFSEPKDVNKQISQLGSMVGVNFFYDDLVSQIVMRAETPELDASVINTIDDSQIVEHSVKFINSEKERVSRVHYYYNLRDHTEDRDKPRNFKNLYIAIDADGELPVEYGKESSKTIYAYGITDTSTATSVSQRILSRFKVTPKTVTFELDAANTNITTGDHFFLNTRHIVDFNGVPTTLEMQCLSSQFDSKKQVNKIKAKQFRFGTLNTAGIAANDVAAFSTGGGTGSELVPYTGVRSSNSYLSDANHITVELLNGGTGFGNSETITFSPASGATRSLAVTYTQSAGVVQSIDSVSSNLAAGALPTVVHNGYAETEILLGAGSSGTGLQIKITKRARMSGAQEPYTVA